MERVLPTVARLVERAPDKTVFTRFIPPLRAEDARGMWRGYYRKWAELTRENVDPSLLELMPELQRYVPPGRIFDKPVYSAFATGELQAKLRRRGTNTLIVTGAETDVCVLSTVLAAVDLGYRVIIVEDALCSSADESHDALLGLYRRRFDLQVELTDSEQLLEVWRR
jgi:nicotinamidase-related amidase